MSVESRFIPVIAAEATAPSDCMRLDEPASVAVVATVRGGATAAGAAAAAPPAMKGCMAMRRARFSP